MYLQGLRRDGSSYTPEFVESIDFAKCLGCGRCYKVCSHEVYTLVEKESLDLDDDDDDGAMVMAIAESGNCIGCTACGKVCSRKCHVFKPLIV
ncbi:MAG: ferredoxin III, nif-specific [Proteobacteria bacterium]|nr:ferredoxin III, nif-specific [Pseudomonadota bacterium]